MSTIQRYNAECELAIAEFSHTFPRFVRLFPTARAYFR
ncbi:hypothetical protein EPHNCH_0196 [Anaplasma phagocytophilum str. NCH-1]|uniref:Uncharacterized protein n=1 Tax=Anaplasma phagocytophilum str. NCH-1 TaxID=1359161 RepID=A0A0F3NLH9_ANAPH|nr:hypothetical protein APHWEB_0528 [Anaplasma phagocytophilum str. Webster]KJV68547.1 hypothetical protein EPHNCH_0196 [Anaplasma phagocytophilum str. NCH-1]KJV86400.1 hypothetical protein APHNYW_1532 [Anaplasma phagocytophilum str. ApNYW]